MEVLRIATFSYQNKGGNPEEVIICSSIAKENDYRRTLDYLQQETRSRSRFPA